MLVTHGFGRCAAFIISFFRKLGHAFRRISSNAIFQTAAVCAVLVHAGALLSLWYLPSGLKPLLVLNAVVAFLILLFAATRARYIFARFDGPYVGLLALELAVLVSAWKAYQNVRVAMIGSYIAFGLHSCVCLATAVFAFAFKMTRLM